LEDRSPVEIWILRRVGCAAMGLIALDGVAGPGIQLVELQEPGDMVPVGMGDEYMVDLPAFLQQGGYQAFAGVEEDAPFFDKVPGGEEGGGISGDGELHERNLIRI